ncbi:MmgE/PrpD family protein [Bordetella tumulicola]|uniref:MmgE/PrpD family protein n=1 Tax=Bordetella tumulicola TaxID=1649133 RepID=UPI0039F10488
MTTRMPLALTLAKLCLRPVDARTRDRSALHVMHWHGGAALAAVTELATHVAHAHGGIAPASDVGAMTSDTVAALMPGPADLWFESALGSLLEIDDTHRGALVHPGPVIVPVVLHMGRALRASGPTVLDALARGYEATIRMGLAANPAHYRFFHPTATCGAIGAAVAAAALLKLSAEQCAHAICLAATQAAGLWQIRLDDCDAKPWHTQRAAQVGVQAALWARAGLTGPEHALEGDKGFFAALSEQGNATAVLNAPDSDPHIHGVSFKPWTACRHAHAAIAAALDVRKMWLSALSSIPPRTALVDEIRSIDIHTYDDAIAFCDRPEPVSAAQARFSLQHVVAQALLSGSLEPAQLDGPSLTDPDCARLRSLTRLLTDARSNARYPAHFGSAVTMSLKDGRTFQAQADDAPGDPENPLTLAALTDLTQRLMMAAGWTVSETQAKIQACLALPVHADWDALSPLQPASMCPRRIE